MQLQTTNFETFFESPGSFSPSLKHQCSFVHLKQLSQERANTKIKKSNICLSPQNKNKKITIDVFHHFVSPYFI